MTRAVLRSRGQITLPQEVRKALHVQEGDVVAFVIEADQVTIHGLKSIPAEQAWFWTHDWQVGEREANEQITAGEGTVFDTSEVFLDSLG